MKDNQLLKKLKQNPILGKIITRLASEFGLSAPKGDDEDKAETTAGQANAPDAVPKAKATEGAQKPTKKKVRVRLDDQPIGVRILHDLLGDQAAMMVRRRKLLVVGGLSVIILSVFGVIGKSVLRNFGKTKPKAGGVFSLPQGFLWGTVSSAIQAEGAGTQRQPTIWDDYPAPGGKVIQGSEHFKKIREDLKILAESGVKAYKFSISWSRVIPEGVGEINRRGFYFYDRLVDEILTENIEPYACLYHWDMPTVLQKRGGWTNRDSANWFRSYAVTIDRRLGDRINNWLMMTDPAMATIRGYGLGEYPPYIKDQEKMYAAVHHQNLGLARAMREIRRTGRGSYSIGSSFRIQPVFPVTSEPADYEAARKCNALVNSSFLQPLLLGSYPAEIEKEIEPHMQYGDSAEILEPLDFIGVDYFNRLYVKAVSDPNHPVGFEFAKSVSEQELTMGGDPIEAGGLLEILRGLNKKYGQKPLLVTANGAAEEPGIDDKRRIDYLHRHILMCSRAIYEGIQLKGYFAYSFLDQFEWEHGFNKPYGLVRVDPKTKERQVRESYKWFRNVARSNVVPAQLPDHLRVR